MTRAELEKKVVRAARYKVNLAPSLQKVLGYVREDVREMEWDKLASDQHTILVAKADVLQIIHDWIAYCNEEWPDHRARQQEEGK